MMVPDLTQIYSNLALRNAQLLTHSPQPPLSREPPHPSPQVLDILRESGYTEDRFYIHCDGALFGMMMPFLKDAPMVTFKKPIGSVSVSGHKFVGAPVPCGVVITRFKYVMALSTDVE